MKVELYGIVVFNIPLDTL